MKRILLIFLVIFFLAGVQFAQEFSLNLRQSEDGTGETEDFSPSANKNVLFSLLLPGAGQWNMGYSGRGKFFLGTDFLLWVSFFGSQAYAGVIRDNYQSFAAVHAGTHNPDKNDQYWIDVGSSDNLYSHNTAKLRDRNVKGLYPETDQYYWQWDSDDSRKTYNNLRVREHDWENRATFVIGALILNRVVSAVDVIRIIRKEKRESQNRMSRLFFTYLPHQSGMNSFKLNVTVSW